MQYMHVCMVHVHYMHACMPSMCMYDELAKPSGFSTRKLRLNQPINIISGIFKFEIDNNFFSITAISIAKIYYSYREQNEISGG